MIEGESYCAFLDCAVNGKDSMITDERYCCQNRCRADMTEYGSLQSPFFEDYKLKCMEENKSVSYGTYDELMRNVDVRIEDAKLQDITLLTEIMQVPGAFEDSTKIIDVVEYEKKNDSYYYKIIITDTQNIRQHIIFMRWSNLEEFIKKLKDNYKDISGDIDIPKYYITARDDKVQLEQSKAEIQTCFDKLVLWSTEHLDTGISGLLNSSPFNELYSKYNYKKYIEISGGSKMKTKKRKYKTKKRKYNTKKKKYNTKKRKYKTKKRKYNT